MAALVTNLRHVVGQSPAAGLIAMVNVHNAVEGAPLLSGAQEEDLRRPGCVMGGAPHGRMLQAHLHAPAWLPCSTGLRGPSTRGGSQMPELSPCQNEFRASSSLDSM